MTISSMLKSITPTLVRHLCLSQPFQVIKKCLSKFSRNYLFFHLASWGAYILGTFIGWSSPVQPQLQHIVNATVPPKVTDPASIWYMKLTDTEMSLVGSFVNLGALLGALVAGFLMDKFGRKLVLIFMSFPSVIGWLLIIAAVNPSKGLKINNSPSISL